MGGRGQQHTARALGRQRVRVARDVCADVSLPTFVLDGGGTQRSAAVARDGVDGAVIRARGGRGGADGGDAALPPDAGRQGGGAGRGGGSARAAHADHRVGLTTPGSLDLRRAALTSRRAALTFWSN